MSPYLKIILTTLALAGLSTTFSSKALADEQICKRFSDTQLTAMSKKELIGELCYYRSLYDYYINNSSYLVVGCENEIKRIRRALNVVHKFRKRKTTRKRLKCGSKFE